MKQLIEIKDEFLELSKGIIDFDKFNNYAIVHHGSTIEGSTLTKDETYLLLDENLTPKNKPLVHSLMTVDHFNALKYVLIISNKKEKLSIPIIQELSSLVLKNTGSKISTMAGDFDSSKGEFRKATVRAGDRTFMDYKKVPDRVEELINHINESIVNNDDYLVNSKLAFDAHFQMLSIHPFADGNGRLSRLLMNYIQNYHKQPLTVVFQEDKKEYFQALENTREKEDIKIFRSFMFNQSKKYFNRELELLNKEQKFKKNNKGLSFLF